MIYRHLAEHLRPTADKAAAFFKKDQGVRNFQVEEAIDSLVSRSTLYATMQDHHFLCIEVHESPYPRTLDSFVLDCIRFNLPVRLYVAIPEVPKTQTFNEELRRAKQVGVGVIEIDSRITVLQDAVPLSLAGLRPVDKSKFPSKYRLALSQAEHTFRNGDPPKGCSTVYDEVESLSRKIAKKTFNNGFWNLPATATPPAAKFFDKDPWETVLTTWWKYLNRSRCGYISASLYGRVLGLTNLRNQAAHKVKNKKDLIKRDTELRTRFEHAVDLLADLIEAVKPLRV